MPRKRTDLDKMVDPLESLKDPREDNTEEPDTRIHPIWIETYKGCLRFLLEGQGPGALTTPTKDPYLRSALTASFRLADIAEDLFLKRHG